MIPRTFWTINNQPLVLADDWRASTIANGGYNTFSGRFPWSFVRRFDFDQGVLIRGFLESGKTFWEGRALSDPTKTDEWATIQGGGHKLVAEKSESRLCYQTRDPGFTDDGGSPYNGTPSGTISASAQPGVLIWEVSQGTTVATNDQHALICWLQGSKVKRFRGTLRVVGPATGFTIDAYRLSGPAGTRTSITSTSAATGNVDISVTSAQDAFAIALTYTGGGTTLAAPLSVYLSDVRVNDLTLADSMEVSAVAQDVGRRCGYDVTGLVVGPGIDTAGAVIKRFFGRTVSPPLIYHDNRGGISVEGTRPTTQTILYTEEIVATSAMNILPLDWSQSWAALLDYLANALDWRWRVLGTTGVGPLLEFGPWGEVWDLDPGTNATPALNTNEKFNRVVVKYLNAAGLPAEVQKDADPDPLHGLVNEWKETLNDNQPDDTLATRIALTLIRRVPARRLSGSIPIVGARDSAGGGSCYEIIAGGNVNVSDGDGYLTLRVTETDMTSNGTTLGVEDHISVGSQIAALVSQARLRKPFGTVSRVA